MLSGARVRPRVQRFVDREALYAAAASAFVAAGAGAVAARGRFAVALAGGDTPRPLYQRLAAAPHAGALDWSRVEVFFGDERCVPPDHPRSNYRMAHETLLGPLGVPPGNIHRMRGEDPPAAAARRYARELRAAWGGLPPCFDLILLGVGEDGHTASLLPGGACVRERRRPVCAQYAAAQQEWRLTVTAPVLEAARAVWVLASGARKAEVVARALEGPYEPQVLPVQLAAPRAGECLWWLDGAAAARLRAAPP